ncbi:CAP domain-containing protein [Cohnella herbarum]|uniref:CAP domain-containing protein n=1 Tax=Cohnella herbarum TaxID=2728023 RepID=A0A7Z2VNZ4_9BACL|nr:CAP domain-containing protein [Cohnella herbarum]QJD86823.1 CAP domain-containing protein [Cohnella herbarum]
MNRKLSAIPLILALFLAVLLPGHTSPASAASTASAVSVAAAASAIDSGLPIRTPQQIAAQWKKRMSSPDDREPYIDMPSVSAPYSPGSLKTDYIQDGVNAINFYRFISGLSDNITATKPLNVQAQFGSVLLAAEDNFSHTPKKPADMSKDFYGKGYESTSSANIYASFGYDGHIVTRSINAYMDDSDTYNLSVLGHRRWILNPPLKFVGIGLAESEDEWTYSALQVFDTSGNKKLEHNFVAYPGESPFPIEVFGPHQAWSISLNMDKFKKPEKKNVKVSLTRLKDNRTWKLNSKNGKVTGKGAYFNVENTGYGTGSAIIFRPDGIVGYRAGDRFKVQVLGLQSKDGKDLTISYTVNFMTVKK